MRILVVSGPHAFATRDMFTGHTWGLRQLLGEDNVHTYDIIPRYNLFSLFADVLEEKFGKGNVPREIRANVLAAEPIFAKAHLVRADWVYFLSPMYMPMSFVQLLRADGFKCAVYFTECPYEDHLWASTQAKHFDVCFVNDRNSVTPFQIYNPQSYYLAPMGPSKSTSTRRFRGDELSKSSSTPRGRRLGRHRLETIWKLAGGN